MINTNLMFDYALYAMLFAYTLLVIKCLFSSRSGIKTTWLSLAIVSWPLFMADEWMRLLSLAQLTVFYGLTDVFAIVVISCSYKIIKPMIEEKGASGRLLWLPFCVVVTVQIFVFFLPLSDKSQWLLSSPVGYPLQFWPLYLSSLFTAFSLLLIGIIIAEDIQRYHRHLPTQAVDVKKFRIPVLSNIVGSTVAVGFISILLVTAAGFGFLNLPYWEKLLHFVVGLMLLILLYGLTARRTTSPSPIDYKRFDKGAEPPAVMREIIETAEKSMIEQKAYKVLGLTLNTFCKSAKIDPTALAIALRWELKKDFRGFVYQYRLEYAKKVLLRSDAKIAKVAQRLGLHSEKFLSDYLVKHLQKH